MGCPICGSGIFGATGERQTDSLSSHDDRPWKHEGWPFTARTFHLVGFSLQAVHNSKNFRLRANRTCQAEGREAQGESREEVERVKY